MGFKIKRNATDKVFSDCIRTRDKFTCRICNTNYGGLVQGIEAAHLFPGRMKGLRWDMRAAVALCSSCHYLGGINSKTGLLPFDRGMSKVTHTKFIIEWIGRKTYNKLNKIHNGLVIKVSKDEELKIRKELRNVLSVLNASRDGFILGKH